jgi:hypothetical protein
MNVTVASATKEFSPFLRPGEDVSNHWPCAWAFASYSLVNG